MKVIPPELLAISRTLRKNQTPWEEKLWQYLRAGRLGVKFKRQVRIGNYIVDFYCAGVKLIIELDGGHHNENLTSLRDQKKEEYLKAEGYRILRFWNNELNQNLEGSLEVIKEACKPLPPRLSAGHPPLVRGGQQFYV